jgi:hypothetical protein
MPYIQSGISQMYCLSPGARESWGVTSFRVEKNLLDFGLVLVPFPRGLTHPFIVQGGPPYKWTKCREREIQRERVPCPVDRGHQPCQSESSGGHRPAPVSRSGHLYLSLCVVLRRSEGQACADKRGMEVMLHPQRCTLSFCHDGSVPATS